MTGPAEKTIEVRHVPAVRARFRRPGRILAVAPAFTACRLLSVPPAMGLGWGEAVYVSQVSPRFLLSASALPAFPAADGLRVRSGYRVRLSPRCPSR